MNNSPNSMQMGPSLYKNYVLGDKVFILDYLETDNTALLIGDLATCVNDPMMFGKTIQIYINSPGGEVSVMKSILSLMSIAKFNDITVETYVIGMAYSAASIIAICGDIRYMTRYAQHLIHFGTVPSFATKYSEIDKIMQQTKEHADQLNSIYIENTTLNQDKLDELQNDERGFLNADDCLKYKLCDYVLEYNLFEKYDFNEAYGKFNEEYFKKGYYKTEEEIKKELKVNPKNIKSKKVNRKNKVIKQDNK